MPISPTDQILRELARQNEQFEKMMGLFKRLEHRINNGERMCRKVEEGLGFLEDGWVALEKRFEDEFVEMEDKAATIHNNFHNRLERIEQRLELGGLPERVEERLSVIEEYYGIGTQRVSIRFDHFNRNTVVSNVFDWHSSQWKDSDGSREMGELEITVPSGGIAGPSGSQPSEELAGPTGTRLLEEASGPSDTDPSTGSASIQAASIPAPTSSHIASLPDTVSIQPVPNQPDEPRQPEANVLPTSNPQEQEPSAPIPSDTAPTSSHPPSLTTSPLDAMPANAPQVVIIPATPHSSQGQVRAPVIADPPPSPGGSRAVSSFRHSP